MCRVAAQQPEIPALGADDLPVESMHWTVAEHYEEEDPIPLGDGRQFDDDLRRVFATRTEAPVGEQAALFLKRHEGEMVVRMSYWAGVAPAVARALLQSLRVRAEALRLHVVGFESTTLIELSAFGTAVLLHWRYTRVADAPSHAPDT